MTYYDSRLKELQEKMERKRRLEVLLQSLKEQEKELSYKVYDLKEIRYKEDADVNRLERRSLANFFYHAVGKHEEKIVKERGEAYQAAVKYDMANLEWEQVKSQIANYETEVKELRGCEKEYETALREKQQKIKESNVAEAANILRLQEEITKLESQRKEIKEAMAAGRSTLSRMEDLMSSLNSAESWGTWDVIGGGVWSDLAKYNRLDEAQEKIERLQLALRSFKTELADVKMEVDIQLGIDGFTKFADFAFDNFFTDWLVLDKIRKSQQQVVQKRENVEWVLGRLGEKLYEIEQTILYKEAEVEKMTVAISI